MIQLNDELMERFISGFLEKKTMKIRYFSAYRLKCYDGSYRTSSSLSPSSFASAYVYPHFALTYQSHELASFCAA